GTEQLDVVDLGAGAGDPCCSQCLLDPPRELGEALQVMPGNLEPEGCHVVGAQEEPVAAPGDVAGDGVWLALPLDDDLRVLGVAVGRDVVHAHPAVYPKFGRHVTDGSLEHVATR